MRGCAPLRDRRNAASVDRIVLFDAGGFESAVIFRHAWLATERHLCNLLKVAGDAIRLLKPDGTLSALARLG